MDCTADEGFTRELYNEKIAQLTHTASAVYVAKVLINRTWDLFRDRIHVNDKGANEVDSQWLECVDLHIRQVSSPVLRRRLLGLLRHLRVLRHPLRLVVTACVQTRFSWLRPTD